MLKLLILVFVFVGCAESECPGEDTSLAPRPVKRKKNLTVCEAPYHDSNCTCPSSMFECACHKIGKCKANQAGCIDMALVYDKVERNDCGDWSDELSDVCPKDKFKCDCFNNCTSRSGCILKTELCDGIDHCGDGSDEVNCTCPAYKFECPCFKTKSCVRDGCISRLWVCNFEDDCVGWADEVNCTCPANTFECPCHKNNSCKSLQGGCPLNYWKCNGVDNCGDWSDEIGCTCPPDRFECECYKTKNCPLHVFIGCPVKHYRCDGKDDCGDGSDEVNCTCPPDKFQCECVKAKQCIGKELSCVDRSLLCDGKHDCVDGSDEMRCRCSTYYTFNGKPFIECHSELICSSFYIQASQRCNMLAMTCVNEKQAISVYGSNFTKSLNCHSLLTSTCASGIEECEAGKLVCTKGSCTNSEFSISEVFFCESQQLIPNIHFCDGQTDPASNCGDKSDELQQGFGFKCSGLSRIGVCVLPQTNVYDSVAQCSDRSDICFHEGQFTCFQCLDKKLIVSSGQVCDGVVDCFDMSDECLCENQSLCRDIRGDCPQNLMRCSDSSECVDQAKVLCNTSVKCLNNINTKYCSNAAPLNVNDCAADDNIWNKENADNKSLCVRAWRYYFKQKAILFNVGNAASLYKRKWCDGRVFDEAGIAGERFCPNRFSCLTKGEINIESNKACDGIIDCDDGSDEFLEHCKSTRYYCRSKQRFSIDKSHVCDGIVDCDDKSDEARCRCEATRFYCANGRPLSITTKLVQNGLHDCSDGSDECVNLAADAFADVNEMIANSFYRGIFWVTGVLSLGGNLFVFVTTTHGLFRADKEQNMLINSSIFILNLCISDLFMGVYLLAIIIKARTFSGGYCLADKAWRSSDLCSGLGALAVTSSEASAFTMTSMTTFRLISVYNPFLMRNVDISAIVFVEVVCWFVAILLAIVPLLNATSEYFTTDVWFPNNFFQTDFVSRKNMSLLAQRISNSKQSSWNDVKSVIANTFPRNPILGEFGYYGETSVCMPRLFATSSEFAWEYTTFLISLNFLMFIYMVVAYLLIYKRSNRMKESRSTDDSSKMQKRITRLIFTDFCCWIPICVMGFFSVGGVKMPGDAYVLSACLLLPINSALNPFLYSKALEKLLSKIKKYIATKLTPPHFKEKSVRYNPRAELQGRRVIEIVD